MNSCNVLFINNISVKLEKSADIFSKSDPYVRIIYGKTYQRTNTKINMDSATWKQKMLFPYLEDNVNTFTVQVFDEDEHTKDDMILSETFTISHDIAERGLTVEKNGITLFYGIGRFCLLKDMKEVFNNIDKVQSDIHRVYSSFKLL